MDINLVSRLILTVVESIVLCTFISSYNNSKLTSKDSIRSYFIAIILSLFGYALVSSVPIIAMSMYFIIAYILCALVYKMRIYDMFKLIILVYLLCMSLNVITFKVSTLLVGSAPSGIYLLLTALTCACLEIVFIVLYKQRRRLMSLFFLLNGKKERKLAEYKKAKKK